MYKVYDTALHLDPGWDELGTFMWQARQPMSCLPGLIEAPMCMHCLDGGCCVHGVLQWWEEVSEAVQMAMGLSIFCLGSLSPVWVQRTCCSCTAAEVDCVWVQRTCCSCRSGLH